MEFFAYQTTRAVRHDSESADHQLAAPNHTGPNCALWISQRYECSDPCWKYAY
ncbi:MAG: hypothetical protein QOH93_2067 [Chloroflexia bacterium]|nr:hypothetical protein [Chloroflexia bacterium]